MSGVTAGIAHRHPRVSTSAFTVLDAGGGPPRRHDLHLHPATAVGAVARWFELPGGHTRGVIALRGGEAAAIAIHQNVADSDLTGIFRSLRSSRSAVAERPSVVR
ncbi:hypothetical protein Axi01nite_03050 [Actinoplanes xinjiangensis]|nr:hypothetical protein Axi01nite_03050 [Actinoplanes xinjiangensis]